MPSLQLPRRLHGVTSFNTKLFVFGGSCNDPYWHTNTAEVFDTAIPNSTWIPLSTPLPASGSTSAVTIYPFIYVFLHGKYVCRYDPQQDTYTKLSNLPVYDWHCFDVKAIPPSFSSSSSSSSLTTTQEVPQQLPIVYVMGGASNGKWGPFSYRYNVLTDSWTELAPIPQSKRRVACAIVREPFKPRHQKQQIQEQYQQEEEEEVKQVQSSIENESIALESLEEIRNPTTTTNS